MFWVQNRGVFELDRNGRGCSELVYCNVNLPTVNSSTEGKYNKIYYIDTYVIACGYHIIIAST